MGTTRMGLSAADSVVDSNCRVHTTDNLYVAGSSVFPAGGASIQPTPLWQWRCAWARILPAL